jgi:hypothetical protein
VSLDPKFVEKVEGEAEKHPFEERDDKYPDTELYLRYVGEQIEVVPLGKLAPGSREDDEMEIETGGQQESGAIAEPGTTCRSTSDSVGANGLVDSSSSHARSVYRHSMIHF